MVDKDNGSKDRYVGDGSTTRFEITFDVLLDADGDATGVGVVLLNSLKEEIEQACEDDGGTDYSIDGIEIVMATAPETGEELTLYRKIKKTQELDLVNNDPLDTEALETGFDKLTMIMQELDERTDRMVQQPITDTAASLVFPPVGSRRNSFMAFDEDGNIDVQTGAYPRNWYSNFPYSINEISQHEGEMWISLQNDNQGHEPGAAGSEAYWDKYRLAKVNGTVLTKTSAYTIPDAGCDVVEVETGASDVTITLPTLADNDGRAIKIVKTDTGSGKVIVDGEAAETINGQSSLNIHNQYEPVELIGGTSTWLIKREWENIVSVSDDYTVSDPEIEVIEVTTSTNDVTITLPVLASNKGRELKIIKIDSGSGSVVVDGNGAETVNGKTTAAIAGQYDSIKLIGGVSSWYAEEAYPIGYVYLQFPGEDTPADIGLPGTWSNISGNYAGDFFRAEGGNASEFNAGQQAARILEHDHRINSGKGSHNHGFTSYFASTSGGGYDVPARLVSYNRSAGMDNLVISSATLPQIDTDSIINAITNNDNNPVNQTFRIWKRTS